ncbi:hypothetical protein NP493_29g00004 [Ridgeia piscesae]|uniref:Uncharacterized protein n=1 Tax=Ridgeia piscesae TaxID=27915 RepID=A0AAD9PDD7_RIDPI|nr:hypothetical protein NP493_29g00004 [Ridgeia piscesae]
MEQQEFFTEFPCGVEIVDVCRGSQQWKKSQCMKSKIGRCLHACKVTGVTWWNKFDCQDGVRREAKRQRKRKKTVASGQAIYVA